MNWKEQAVSKRRPHMVMRSEMDTGIVRFTGKAKLKPWMQILHANLPGGEREGRVLACQLAGGGGLLSALG